MPEKNYGLVLDLGGAPNTPHLIPGLPGHFHPAIPVPVGGKGEIELGEARKFSTSNLPVQLRELGPTEAKRAQDYWKEFRENSRLHKTTVPPDPVLAEAAREAKE